MRKLFSTKYSATSFNIAMFLLRLITGALIMNHGYGKLMNFSTMKGTFLNFLGMGSTVSLSLAIFAEFFCGLFLIIGLFSRAVVIPLIVVMTVALFHIHKGDFYGKGESPTLFLAAFLVILLVGPGRASIDGMIGK